MGGKQFESVWDGISMTTAEAEIMKLRSIFMRALKDYIESKNLSRSEAANLLDVNQSDISDLARGKINSFSLDALVNMLAAAGLYAQIKIAKMHCDQATFFGSSNSCLSSSFGA